MLGGKRAEWRAVPAAIGTVHCIEKDWRDGQKGEYSESSRNANDQWYFAPPMFAKIRY